MDPISVLLVDDNPAFLRVTSDFLAIEKDIHVVGTAATGREALMLAPHLKPEVMLIDLAMPDMSGLQVVPLLRNQFPASRIVVLTVMTSQGFQRASIKAGADAFLPKSKMRLELLSTIRKLARPQAEQPITRQALPTPATVKPRILVIEDEASLRHLYQKAFTAANYDVHAAGRMESAKQLLSTNSYDLILCDVHLGSGRATDLLREFSPDLVSSGAQIVMVSGEPQYQSICEEMGADFFLVKPVAISTLISLVERLTSRYIGDGAIAGPGT